MLHRATGSMTLALLGAATLSAPCPAADLSPGLWEISLEVRVPASPDFAPAPFQLTQCMTARDAVDPGRFIGRISNPGASGCTYSNKTYTGNTFSYTIQCAGTFSIQSRGEVTFSPDTTIGTITATANIAGEKTETTSGISARRLGGC